MRSKQIKFRSEKGGVQLARWWSDCRAPERSAIEREIERQLEVGKKALFLDPREWTRPRGLDPSSVGQRLREEGGLCKVLSLDELVGDQEAMALDEGGGGESCVMSTRLLTA